MKSPSAASAALWRLPSVPNMGPNTASAGAFPVPEAQQSRGVAAGGSLFTPGAQAAGGSNSIQSAGNNSNSSYAQQQQQQLSASYYSDPLGLESSKHPWLPWMQKNFSFRIRTSPIDWKRVIARKEASADGREGVFRVANGNFIPKEKNTLKSLMAFRFSLYWRH